MRHGVAACTPCLGGGWWVPVSRATMMKVMVWRQPGPLTSSYSQLPFGKCPQRKRAEEVTDQKMVGEHRRPCMGSRTDNLSSLMQNTGKH